MRWFNVGKIVSTHGLKGEVRVISMTDFPEIRYKKGSKLTFFSNDEDIQLPLTIQSHRQHKDFDLVSFVEFEGVEEVERLKDGLLKISEDELSNAELNENEYFYHQIIGCKVMSEEGKSIGTITEILTPGANDVWVVQADNQERTLYYIPYIESVVTDVDIERKIVTIHVMEGLIE